ncbi:MAG: hypothetical protein BV457_01190 [Thermoplasmata archaeon M9B1D]|nr:MAG: hypothetical protein BV456_09470 [Thermoplasmata archaeon M8B2D]PNX49592.1 MAG: hypothetical protein BV457_01190 [Thermoplasmata archaeon M9B1D]
MKISIIGTGNFGFALAYHLSKKYAGVENINLMACDSNKELITYLQNHKMHLYHFKNKKISGDITFTLDKKRAAHDADVVILSVSSQATREAIHEIKNNLKEDTIILNTAKALEIGTAKTFYEVVKEELKSTSVRYYIAKLSGGTFAVDIVNAAPLGADIACEQRVALKKIQSIIHSSNLRIYGNTDVIGVEYAGAFKNIIAIFAGIIHGLGLPYGSETHIISRAAKEAAAIACKFGAKSHTFSMGSQCWGNDLWMSCTGQSRNREFGRIIGDGKSVKKALTILQKEHKLVEGYYTVKVIPMLCKKAKVEAPIFNEIYKMIYENKKPSESIEYLMNRNVEYIE